MKLLKGKRSCLFLLAALALISSCDYELRNNPMDNHSLDNVKTITTRFISHQEDLSKRDNQLVAVASFRADGSVEKVVRHSSYPYGSHTPSEMWIWSDPDPENVVHIMDGLDLEKAEYNLLYGNDWPVKYAQVAKTKSRYGSFSNFSESAISIAFQVGEWPSSISFQEPKTIYPDGKEIDGTTLIERFEYENDRVVEYLDGYIPDPMVIEHLIGDRKNSAQIHDSGMILHNKYDFVYSEDLLSSLEVKNKTYKFYYSESKQLIRSEFHVNNKLYNYRNYTYNELGLKTETSIFNVYNEPEYTIKYEYEFFENS